MIKQSKLNQKSKQLAVKYVKMWKLFVKLKAYKQKLKQDFFTRWIEKLAARKKAVWRDEIRSKIHSNYNTYSSVWKAWRNVYRIKLAEKQKLELAIGYANILSLRGSFDALSLYREIRSKKKELNEYATKRADDTTRSTYFQTWKERSCLSKKTKLQTMLAIASHDSTLKLKYFRFWELRKEIGKSERKDHQISVGHYNKVILSRLLGVWMQLYRKQVHSNISVSIFKESRKPLDNLFHSWADKWKLRTLITANEELAENQFLKSTKFIYFIKWKTGTSLALISVTKLIMRDNEKVLNYICIKDSRKMVSRLFKLETSDRHTCETKD